MYKEVTKNYRWFFGTKSNGEKVIFKSRRVPTSLSHPHDISYCNGPYSSKKVMLSWLAPQRVVNPDPPYPLWDGYSGVLAW